jgi:hypothetical protein
VQQDGERIQLLKDQKTLLAEQRNKMRNEHSLLTDAVKAKFERMKKRGELSRLVQSGELDVGSFLAEAGGTNGSMGGSMDPLASSAPVSRGGVALRPAPPSARNTQSSHGVRAHTSPRKLPKVMTPKH